MFFMDEYDYVNWPLLNNNEIENGNAKKPFRYGVETPYPIPSDFEITFGFDDSIECEEDFVKGEKEEEEKKDEIEDWQCVTVKGKAVLRTSGYFEGCSRIELDENIHYVKASGCVFTRSVNHQADEPLKKSLVGGGKAGKPGKYKKMSVKPAYSYLHSILTKENSHDLSSVGPYGAACQLLGMKNKKDNRKRIKISFQRKLHDDQLRKSPEKKVINLFSKKSIPKKIKTVSYCVCNADDSNWQEGGPMAACEGCSHWYHYKCICGKDIKLNRFFTNGKQVKFICGLRHCRFNEGYLRVRGTSYKLRHSLDLNSQLVEEEKQEECVREGKCQGNVCRTEEDNCDVIGDNSNFLKDDNVDGDTDGDTDIDMAKDDNVVNTKIDGDTDIDMANDNDLVKNIIDGDIDMAKDNDNVKDAFGTRDVSLDNNKELAGHQSALKIDQFKKIFKDIKSIFLTVKDFKYTTSTAKEHEKLKVRLSNSLESLDSIKFEVTETGYSEKTELVSLIESLSSTLDQHKEDFYSEDDIDLSESFSKKTVSSVLGIDIPDQFFCRDLPASIVYFDFDEKIWDMLYKDRCNRHFKRNTWQEYFINGIKKSNPYCVFCFKNHTVSVAVNRRRPTGSPLFSAEAFCKFIDCTCNVVLKMYCATKVSVFYKGLIKHDIKDKHFRKITGVTRESLKEKFVGGVKPLSVFLEKLDELSPEQLLSGNLDGIGKSSKVYAQIASESRQSGREDKDLISSLIFQKDVMKKETPGGFIQKISVSPMYILYWSTAGIEMYNDRANNNAVFWDATGSVVRKGQNGKKFLYYEMALNSPVKGKMGVPITSMLSEDHSLPVILDWIRSFRHAEKLRFGHSRIVPFPKKIISDQSMVLIMAALKEFNNESLQDYLKRCWKIVTGVADYEDFQKSKLHLCTSHFMKSVKRYLKKKDVAVKKVSTFLYIVGLILNCEEFDDLKELLTDIFVSVGSKTIHESNRQYISRLSKKINSFNSSANENILDDLTSNNENTDKNINPDVFTEEDFQVFGTMSPFKKFGKDIYVLSTKYFESGDCRNDKPNPWYCDIFINYFLKQLIPILPLWSTFILDKNCPDKNDNAKGYINSPRTNNLIENRFRILKHICLNGRTQHRIDEFSDILKKHTLAIQKLAVIDSLKPGKVLKRHLFTKKESSKNLKYKKKTMLVEEKWNKKNQQPLNLKNDPKKGKYQKAPKIDINLLGEPILNINMSEKEKTPLNSKRLSLSKSKFVQSKKLKTEDNSVISLPVKVCKLKNFGNTCWFNSVLQAFCFSNFSLRVITYFDTNNVHVIEPSNRYLTSEYITDIWRFMQSEGKGKVVPENLLRPALTKICSLIPNFTQGCQQDSHEFVNAIIGDMSNIIEDYLEIEQKQSCSQCNKTTCKIERSGNEIVINLQPGLTHLSIQTLIENIFLNEEIYFNCTDCKMETCHIVRKNIKSFPETLIIVLGRYAAHEGNFIKKLQNPVYISPCLSFPIHDKSILFNFKSAVCHFGNSTSAGHYSAIVKSNDSYVCCSDTSITDVNSDVLLNTAYIIVYDRDEIGLPDYFKGLLNCFVNTNCLKYLLKHEKISFMPFSKKSFIQDLAAHGVTDNVRHKVKFDLNSQLHKYFESHNKIVDVVNFYKMFLNYVFEKKDCTSSSIKSEFFEIKSLHLYRCEKCDVSSYQLQTSLITSVYNFKSNFFSESLKLSGLSNENSCRCSSIYKKILFLSLPSILVFHVNKMLKFKLSDFLVLDLSKSLDFCFSLGSMCYSLKAILCCSENQCKAAKKIGNDFVCCDSGIKFELGDVSEFENVLLFYSKTSAPVSHTLPMTRKVDNSKLPVLFINDTLKEEKVIHPKSLFGVKLNKQFYQTILDERAWLSSHHINLYLSVIASKCKNKVHIVDSGWFSSRMCKNGNPEQIIWYFDGVESGSSWLNFDFVVIPVNELNKHWTVAIIDVRKKYIIYCNSLGCNEKSKSTCFQIWRYLCYEALINSKQLLGSKTWNITYYNESHNFPLQTDGSSCGVYVCAVVNAVLFNVRLPYIPNLVSFRKSIAYEISGFKK